MKNNRIEISIADIMEIDDYSVWIGCKTINSIIADAYGTVDCDTKKKFIGRVTIKIEDLSEPLRILRPEEPAEREAQE